MNHTPYLFNEFIDSGLAESSSPFLKPDSRKFAKNIPLKISIISAFLLLVAFALKVFLDRPLEANLLLVLVYFLAGIPSLIAAIEDLINLTVNIDVLMTLAAFLSVLIGSGMEGALLLVLFSLSGSIEDSVTSKAKSALSHLRELAPTKATVLDDKGTLFERSIKDILIGQKIIVKSGDVIPLDCKVIEGTSDISLVHLTGENLPITKTIGDLLPAGSRNGESMLVLEVLRTSADSTLTKLITLITEAQEAKPRLQRFIDKVSEGYAFSIIGISFLATLIMPFIFSIPFLGDEGSIYRSLAFLIAASPCALIIAIPIGYLSAISACAKKGILLKGGIILDALASCKAIAFDKTGTLTYGELALKEIIPLNAEDTPGIAHALNVAFSLERGSSHPIATAIINLASHQNLQSLSLKNYKVIPGMGVEAIVGDQKAYIGKISYVEKELPLEQKNILLEKRKKTDQEGMLLAVLKIEQHFYLFVFQDKLREGMKPLLSRLKAIYDMRLIMLTGDHSASAKAVAKELPLDDYWADLLPHEKLKMVEELSKKTHLAMVGDGINDAPALARATVGISMGKVGSTTAVDASDIVLLHDDLNLLEWLIGKSKMTKRVILQNVIIAFSAILFASIPALLGFVPLWLAVILHEGGTVIVGLNSLRLLKIKG